MSKATKEPYLLMAAKDFNFAFNKGLAAGLIRPSDGVYAKLREMVTTNNRLSTTVEDMKSTMFSKCPKCGYQLPGEVGDVVGT
jgi:hypothetical protein